MKFGAKHHLDFEDNINNIVTQSEKLLWNFRLVLNAYHIHCRYDVFSIQMSGPVRIYKLMFFGFYDTLIIRQVLLLKYIHKTSWCHFTCSMRIILPDK